MSTATTAKQARMPVIIADEAGEVDIPSWVTDHESFRRWAWSDQYPDHGWISYLQGTLWVDMSMEELLFHNQVKGEYAVVLGGLVKTLQSGRYVHDRMMLTHPGVGLSTEPDGLFMSWNTLRQGRIRPVQRPKKKGSMELEGTPDMVLEVVSDTSEKKDREVLFDLYWQAGVAEYWLVDARGDKPSFDIYRRRARGYFRTRAKSGWLRSVVFKRFFKLMQQKDPLGEPQFALLVRDH